MSPLTLLLAALNVGVSLWAFRATDADRDRFVFIPYAFKQGRNTTGMVLSHFAHADGGHLVLNMLGLYFFGPVLEQGLGAASLGLVYVVSGLVATAAIFLIRHNDPRFRALGASGSVAGVLFAAIIVRPEMDLFLMFVPIPIAAPIFAVLYLVASTYLMGRQGSRICHEAHVGGAIAGTVLGAVLSPAGVTPLLIRVQDLFT